MAAEEHELSLRGHSVVLGTSSKWRRALFEQHFAGVPYTHASADIDEARAGGARAGADARELTQRIAHAKADALLPAYRGTRTLLLTLDQVVVAGGAVLEKPRDAAEARAMLRSYARHAVATVTAVVVTECAGGARVSGVDEASLRLRALPEAVIDALIAKGDVLRAAGGVTVEDALVRPYHGERRGELASVLGLPVRATRRLLSAAARLGARA